MKVLKIFLKIIAGLLLVLAILAAVLVWWKLPAYRAAKGIIGLLQEVGERSNPILEGTGWEGIVDRLTGGQSRIVLDGSVFTQEQREAFGTHAVFQMDQKKKRVSLGADSRLLGLNFGSVVLSGDEKNLYMQISALPDQVFWAGTEDFGARYQNSMWARWLKLNVGADDQLCLVPKWESSRLEETSKLWRERLRAGRDFLAQNPFLAALVLDVKKEEEDSYLLTIPQKLVNPVLETVQTELESGTYGENVESAWDDMMQGQGKKPFRLAEDLKLLIRMDDQKRVTQIATAGMVPLEERDLTFGFSLDFTGEEYCLDAVEGKLQFQDREGVRSFSLGRQLTPREDGQKEQWELKTPEVSIWLDMDWHFATKEFEVDLKKVDALSTEAAGGEGSISENTVGTGDSQEYELHLAGSLVTTVPGESVTLKVDTLTLPVMGVHTLQISGSLLIEPMKEELVLPTGGIDFLGMSELDVLKLVLGFGD